MSPRKIPPKGTRLYWRFICNSPGGTWNQGWVCKLVAPGLLEIANGPPTSYSYDHPAVYTVKEIEWKEAT